MIKWTAITDKTQSHGVRAIRYVFYPYIVQFFGWKIWSNIFYQLLLIPFYHLGKFEVKVYFKSYNDNTQIISSFLKKISVKFWQNQFMYSNLPYKTRFHQVIGVARDKMTYHPTFKLLLNFWLRTEPLISEI